MKEKDVLIHPPPPVNLFLQVCYFLQSRSFSKAGELQRNGMKEKDAQHTSTNSDTSCLVDR
jgi:hypothetical protein